MSDGIFTGMKGRRLAEEIFSQMVIHDHDTGGAFTVITGSKGCGKSTLLHHLLRQVVTLDGKKLVLETVILRARPGMTDVWGALMDPSYPWPVDGTGTPLRRGVWFHHHHGDRAVVSEEGGGPLGGLAGRFRAYGTCMELYHNLVPGAVNVVLEPSSYEPSEEFMQALVRKSLVSEKKIRRMDLDPGLWWVEFCWWLLFNKGTEGISIFIDEADEIFQRSPSGIRYHYQSLFGSLARDFRKRLISFFMTLHNWSDSDWAVTSKANYFGWMRGRRPPQFSQVARYEGLIAALETGTVIWEHGGYGGMTPARIPFPVKAVVEYVKMEKSEA